MLAHANRIALLALAFAACDGGTDPEDLESPETARTLPPLAQAEVSPPPISGGTLAVLGGVAVAADPDRDLVYVVDLDTWALRHTVEVPGAEPGRVVLDEAHAFVALRRGGVLRVALSDGVSVRHEVCPAPRGLAFEGARLHVACAGGELVTLALDGAVERRVYLDTDLRDVVVAGGQLYVTRFRAAELLTVDASGAVVARRGPARDDHLVQGGAPRAPAVAWRTIGRPDGSVLMLHQRASLGRVEVQTPSGYGDRSGPCGGALVAASMTMFQPTGEVLQAGELMRGVVAVDVSVSPEAGLAVATPGAATGGLLRERLGPGLELVGPCYTGRGSGGDGEVTAVAHDRSGRLYYQSREPARLSEGRRELELSPRSAYDAGHDLFHRDAGTGIACASCHPEGLEDGHTWLFEDLGLRRTQSLLGGLKGSEPFHWDGDMADFRALAHEVMADRMGGPRLPEAYAALMLDWIDAQPLPPGPVEVDAAAVARGAVVFAEAGCERCHVGGVGSDNENHDVGTGGDLQTPALRGLRWRAPFMHDGCAQTLAERFDADCGGGDLHGRTSQLSADALGDLVTYLETL